MVDTLFGVETRSGMTLLGTAFNDLSRVRGWLGVKLEAKDFLDAVANEIRIQARHSDRKLRNVSG